MKITFIIDSLQHGGAERVVTNLATGLSNFGHDVSILVLSDYGDCSFYNIGSDIKIISLLKTKQEKIGRLSKICRLRKFLKSDKEMLFVAFLPHICIYTYLASIFLKSNYFVSERSDPNQYGRTYKILLKKSFNKALGAVFQSRNAKLFYYKNDNPKSKIIINPINLNVNKEKIKGKDKKIVSVGRLMQEKNFYLLIDAFEIFLNEFPEYILEIYGDGPLKSNLIKYISNKGLDNKVILKGTDSNWISKCINYSCYVCSSDYEGMSNSLEEAACAGIPCISTDCPSGGNRELLNDGEFGILVPIKDAIQLSAAMVKTVKDNLSYDNSKLSKICSLEHVSHEWECFLIERARTKNE